MANKVVPQTKFKKVKSLNFEVLEICKGFVKMRVSHTMSGIGNVTISEFTVRESDTFNIMYSDSFKMKQKINIS